MFCIIFQLICFFIGNKPFPEKWKTERETKIELQIDTSQVISAASKPQHKRYLDYYGEL